MTESTNSETITFPAKPPAKAAPMTAALWPEAAKAHATILGSVKAAEAIKGSAGEILAKARAAILLTEDGAYVAAMVAEFRAAADRGTAWLEQQANEAASAQMKGSEPKAKAAQAKYAEAVKDLESAMTFLLRDKAAAKVLATVTVPSFPKAGRSSSGSSGPNENTSGLAYFRQVKGGDKTYQSSHQNSASSLAYYYGGCLVNEKNGNIGSLVNYASAKGVDVKGATPWTLELPNGTILGCDKVTEAK